MRLRSCLALAVAATVAGSAAAPATAAPAQTRLWYRVSASVTYHYAATVGHWTSVDDRAFSLSSRAAVLVRRRCTDRRNGHRLAWGTCAARYAGHRRPAFAVDDFAFDARADGLWDAYVAVSTEEAYDDVYRGRPFHCDAHTNRIDMVGYADYQGAETRLQAGSALEGLTFDIGWPTTPGTVHTASDPRTCTYTDDQGGAMVAEEGSSGNEGTPSTPLTGVLNGLGWSDPIPFLSRVRFGGRFGVHRSTTVKRWTATIDVAFTPCPRGGRDVAHCDAV